MDVVIKEHGKVATISKQGWVTCGQTRFYARSAWEANIGAYLQFLLECGEIRGWRHEPRTFWFTQWHKRGVVSYLPDFEVTNNDGSVEFWEVKGYMDSRSRTKIARFRKYYPEFKLHVISKQRYKQIASNKSLFRYWGQLGAARAQKKPDTMPGSFSRKGFLG